MKTFDFPLFAVTPESKKVVLNQAGLLTYSYFERLPGSLVIMLKEIILSFDNQGGFPVAKSCSKHRSGAYSSGYCYGFSPYSLLSA